MPAEIKAVGHLISPAPAQILSSRAPFIFLEKIHFSPFFIRISLPLRSSSAIWSTFTRYALWTLMNLSPSFSSNSCILPIKSILSWSPCSSIRCVRPEVSKKMISSTGICLTTSITFTEKYSRSSPFSSRIRSVITSRQRRIPSCIFRTLPFTI